MPMTHGSDGPWVKGWMVQGHFERSVAISEMGILEIVYLRSLGNSPRHRVSSVQDIMFSSEKIPYFSDNKISRNIWSKNFNLSESVLEVTSTVIATFAPWTLIHRRINTEKQVFSDPMTYDLWPDDPMTRWIDDRTFLLIQSLLSWGSSINFRLETKI